MCIKHYLRSGYTPASKADREILQKIGIEFSQDKNQQSRNETEVKRKQEIQEAERKVKTILAPIFFVIFGYVFIRMTLMSDNIINDTSKITKTNDASKVTKRTTPFGIWKVRYYVDNFGDKTKEGYITNEEKIYGKFSNSATTNEKLRVKLLINSYKEAGIQLYEYDGRTPSMSVGKLTISLKDSTGKKQTLSGQYYDSDRLFLSESSSKKLHKALKNGGKVQFFISNSKYGFSTYSFTINNVDGYHKAYKKLFNLKK